MGLAELMVGLSAHTLKVLASELGAHGLDELPASVITEIVMDRLANHANAVEWVMSRVPAMELAAIKPRQV